VVGNAVLYTGMINGTGQIITSKSAELVQRKNVSAHGAITYTVDAWSGDTGLFVSPTLPAPNITSVWVSMEGFLYDTIGELDNIGGTPNFDTTVTPGNITISTSNSIVFCVAVGYISSPTVLTPSGFTLLRKEVGLSGGPEACVHVFYKLDVPAGAFTAPSVTSLGSDINAYLVAFRPV
jgi:hypothetical protein